MQPYLNPYYFQNNQQMYNPSPRYGQIDNQYVTQPQYVAQMPQQNIIVGRVVDDVATVTANEIPMDGNYAIFPKRDMSEIIAKKWNQDGSISTTTYKAQIDDFKSNTNNVSNSNENLKIAISDEVANIFQQKFEELQVRFDKLERSLTQKSSSRTKKESETE